MAKAKSKTKAKTSRKSPATAPAAPPDETNSKAPDTYRWALALKAIFGVAEYAEGESTSMLHAIGIRSSEHDRRELLKIIQRFHDLDRP